MFLLGFPSHVRRNVRFALALALAVASPAVAGWRLAEIQASDQDVLADEDGDISDWIEIENTGTAPADLAGWHLTDDPAVPAKWTFPAATPVAARDRVVVFASGKNRAVAGAPLHANFSLDGDGEYLALTRPDGGVESAFVPGFPAQPAGVSFGIGTIDFPAPLVAATSSARWRVPAAADPGLSWTLPDFDDSGWAGGAAAIGYDDGTPDSDSTLMGWWNFDDATSAVQARDASGLGHHGTVVGATFTPPGSGHTGHATDRAMDFAPALSGRKVTIPAAAAGAFDAAQSADAFTISVWVYGSAALPKEHGLFWAWSTGVSDRSIGAHLPWVDSIIYFDTAGCCGGGETRISKLEPDPALFRGRWNHYAFVKRGTTKEIWQNGILWHQGTNTAALTQIRSFVIGSDPGTSSYPGKIDDFAIWSEALSAGQIQSLRAGAAPNDVDSLAPLVRTDVGSAMKGVSSSAFLRVPFTVDAPSEIAVLRMRVRYDDGFTAYLNGIEIARRQVADDAGGAGSVATANRTRRQALQREEIDVSRFAGALRTGTNVLAFHGVTRSIGSGDFLIEPELMAGREVSNRYFLRPTPGRPAMDPGVAGLTAEPRFSVTRGFFEAPFTLQISCATPGAQIRWTTDGTTPTTTHGTLSESPAALSITGSTAVRAVAFRDDFAPSPPATHTYLFLEQTAGQPAAPPGWPASFGLYGGYGPLQGQPVPADYEMDPQVRAQQAPAAGFTVRDGLEALPAVCLTVPRDDLFDLGTGLYANSVQQGDGWKRAASIELLTHDDTGGFQIDAGLRINGGLSRQHWHTPKHSFRVQFSEEFGPRRLRYRLYPESHADSIDEFVLRASSTDSWAAETTGEGPNNWPRRKATYLRDVWMKDALRDLGRPSTTSRYVHLFINGLYWGQYNLAERPVDAWQADTFGGAPGDYDIVKDVGELEAGSMARWTELINAATAGVAGEAAFEKLRGQNPDGTRNPTFPVLLDVANFIDYMILHIYSGAIDWPNHNWWAARRHDGAAGPGILDSPGFRFFVWDQEIANIWLNATTVYPGQRFEEVNSPNGPGILYDRLRANPRFRRMFGDRVHQLCFNGGALTPGPNEARWRRRQAQIDRSIVAESARWGDSRQEPPLTRATWLAEMQSMVSYWTGIHGTALGRFRRVSLYPTVVAPTMNQFGGAIAAGFQLSLAAPAGTIHFTTNGEDVLQRDGTLSPSATVATGPITLTGDTPVRARAVSSGLWSALVQADFMVARPPAPGDLVVSEVHYHPAPGGAEFVEVLNIAAVPLDLGGVRLAGAVDFTLPVGTKLAPGARLVVVQDGAAFAAAYPDAPPPFGPWFGALKNGGERLALLSRTDVELFGVTFDDGAPWPVGADGDGRSLVFSPHRPGASPDDPAQWRHSTGVGGSPGASDTQPFSGADPDADGDGDGLTARLEYALGTSDADPASGREAVAIVVDPGGSTSLAVTTNLAAEGILIVPEVSADLRSWFNGPERFEWLGEDSPDGPRAIRRYRLFPEALPGSAGSVFVRVRAEVK